MRKGQPVLRAKVRLGRSFSAHRVFGTPNPNVLVIVGGWWGFETGDHAGMGIVFVDVETGVVTPRRCTKGHHYGACCLIRRGRGLVVVGRGAHVWDLRRTKYAGELPGFGDHMQAVACLPGTPVIVAGAYGGAVGMYDPAVDQEFELIGRMGGWDDTLLSDVVAIGVALDGSTFMTGSFGGQVIVWDAAARTKVETLRPNESPVLLVVSPDGQTFATAGSYGTDCEVAIWGLHDCAKRREFHREGDAEGLAFSPDGSLLACYGQGTSVWDIAQDCLCVALDDVTKQALFAPDCSWMATSRGKEKRRSIVLSEPRSGQALTVLPVPGMLPKHLALCDDGHALAAVCSGEDGDAASLFVWDLGSFAPSPTEPGSV